MSDEDEAKRQTNFSLGKTKLNFELIGIEGRLSEKWNNLGFLEFDYIYVYKEQVFRLLLW